MIMDCRFAICDLTSASSLRLSSASKTVEPRLKPRRGFSFTEILFAVMILGIGFIMVAALFPVALQQTQSNVQETIAASIGREGASVASKLAAASLPAPSQISPVLIAPNPWAVPPFNITCNSLLVPTAVQLPAATSGTSFTLPGQVWSFNDSSRDRWFVQFVNPRTGRTTTMLHSAYLWQQVSRNLVLPFDSRYAWVGMYKRDIVFTHHGTNPNKGWVGVPAPLAQVIIIGVQCSNRSQYYSQSTATAGQPDDTAHYQPLGMPATLEPTLLPGAKVNLPNSPNLPTTIQFLGATNAVALGRLAEGAYAVISDSRFANPVHNGMFNGHVFRLGPAVAATPNTWQLMPGNELPNGEVALAGGTFNADVFVVGRGYKDAKVPNNGVEGPAQDITLYTTFVQAN